MHHVGTPLRTFLDHLDSFRILAITEVAPTAHLSLASTVVFLSFSFHIRAKGSHVNVDKPNYVTTPMLGDVGKDDLRWDKILQSLLTKLFPRLTPRLRMYSSL